MKKILIAALAVLMLSACGGTNPEQTEEKEKIGDRGYEETTFDTGEEKQVKEILPEEECDFGNYQWGMALEAVTNVQGAGYKKLDANTIRYERVRIEGFASDAEYVFTDGALSGATYFIMPDSEYEDKMQYITDYESLSAIYTKRFGKPTEETIQFAPGMDTNDKAEQAQLLGEGNILFRTVWTTDTTEIRAVMAKKDGLCIGVKFTKIN